MCVFGREREIERGGGEGSGRERQRTPFAPLSVPSSVCGASVEGRSRLHGVPKFTKYNVSVNYRASGSAIGTRTLPHRYDNNGFTTALVVKYVAGRCHEFLILLIQ